MSSSLHDPGACPVHPVRPEGRGRFRPILLAFLAAFIVVVTLAYVLARTRVEPRVYPPRERGWAYEDHVLAPSALPRRVQAQGGTLVHHPAIYVPPVEVPARYRAAPQGFDGPLVTDERAAGQVWRACKPGAPRIPDAIARHVDGSETLYELKCPSPWLTFAAGTPWATKMQTAFASQAVAFFAWADQAPNRSVVYGFCGWVPPWAAAALDDLQGHFRRTIRVRASFMAAGFAPARALEGRQVVTEGVLGALEALAPEAVSGAAYDLLKD